MSLQGSLNVSTSVQPHFSMDLYQFSPMYIWLDLHQVCSHSSAPIRRCRLQQPLVSLIDLYLIRECSLTSPDLHSEMFQLWWKSFLSYNLDLITRFYNKDMHSTPPLGSPMNPMEQERWSALGLCLLGSISLTCTDLLWIGRWEGEHRHRVHFLLPWRLK